MNDCLFCKIIAGEMPSKIEYQDEEVIVFHDINPKAPVHLLILPKEHLKNINDFSEKEGSLGDKLFLTAKKMAKKMNVDKSGYRLVINNGLDAGQEINHLHIHLLGGKRQEF
ncbi:MAG: histidine triad nucleotide-binding protein [Patescibacteria group bacterium]|nr:histidine triad nucleotide-binding protein [Patescibacteria group bacterium]